MCVILLAGLASRFLGCAVFYDPHDPLRFRLTDPQPTVESALEYIPRKGDFPVDGR